MTKKIEQLEGKKGKSKKEGPLAGTLGAAQEELNTLMQSYTDKMLFKIAAENLDAEGQAALAESGTNPQELATQIGQGADVPVEEAKVGSVRLVDMKPGTDRMIEVIKKNPERATKLAHLKDRCVAELKALRTPTK
jgi:uncharacterized hydantoinase/oxoprolinase family protein